MNIYKLLRCVLISWRQYQSIVFLLLCSIVTTDTITAQRFIGSIHGGINLSQLSGDDLNGFSKTGLHAGASVSYPWANLQKQFAIEFIYQQKGSSATNLTGTRQRIAVNTISLPLIYRWGEWYNEQSERHNFYVEVGTVVNSIIGASSENTFFDNLVNDFNDFDWGLTGGVNINIGQGLSTTVRYERSVTDLFNDPALSVRGLQSFLFTLRVDYRL